MSFFTEINDMKTKYLAFAVAACGFVTMAGCDSGPTLTAVKGKVEMDGKKMESGKVAFVQQGIAQDILEVKDGTFEGKAKVGKAKVEVYSYRQGKIPEMYKDTKDKSQFMENIIAPAYNSESKLTADITKGGTNEFTFSVKSK
ncbi:MAG: hypothetical protein U0744_07115 [Gemmataceae bacterium]